MAPPMDGIFPLFSLNGRINSMEDIDDLLGYIKDTPMAFAESINSYTEKELVYLFDRLGFDIMRTRYISALYGGMNAHIDGTEVYVIYEAASNKLLSRGHEPTSTPCNVIVLRKITDAVIKICHVLDRRKSYTSCNGATYYRDNLWTVLNTITKNIEYCDSIVIPIMTKGKFRTVIYLKDAPSKFIYTEDEPNKVYYYDADIKHLKHRDVKYINEWLAARLLFTLLILEDHVHIVQKGKSIQLVQFNDDNDEDINDIIETELGNTNSITVDVISYLEDTHPNEVSDDKMDDVIYNLILGEE